MYSKCFFNHYRHCSLSCICDHSWSQDPYEIILINLTEPCGRHWSASTHPAEGGLTSVPRERVALGDLHIDQDSLLSCVMQHSVKTFDIEPVNLFAWLSDLMSSVCQLSRFVFLSILLGKVLVPSLFDVRFWFINLRFGPLSSLCFAHLNFKLTFKLSIRIWMV